jgi:hypothetical protein
MPESFEDTTLFRKFRAQPSVPDPLADKIQAQAAFDEVLTPLGVRAPPPEPRESEAQYLARLGEHAAAFGPEERKSVNRYNLPSAALAEFVRQDLEIAKSEVQRPNYTLKEGVLTERHKEDASGRPITEFYSKSGPSIWMKQFMPSEVKYVSGGSNGILDPDKPRPSTHSFMRTQTTPELIEMRRLAAYHDSAEAKVIAAYKAVGKEPPDDVMKKVLRK